MHRDHRFNVAQIGAHLVVVRQQVAGDKELLAPGVGFLDADLDLLELEFVVARAQAVAWLTRIDRIGAKVKGGAHFVQRPGGQQ